MTSIRLRFTFVLIVFALGSHFQMESSSAAQSNQPSKIPAGEAQFTREQLEDYYLVYKNADVRYLRTLFDAYLRGGPNKEEEAKLLKNWSKDYYKSKFIVLSRDKNTFGGTFITIIFQELPDKVFVAWVYEEGSQKRLTLRGFDLGQFNEEDLRRIRTRYRKILEDKVHAM